MFTPNCDVKYFFLSAVPFLLQCPILRPDFFYFLQRTRYPIYEIRKVDIRYTDTKKSSSSIL